jgi:hypothetical protein
LFHFHVLFVFSCLFFGQLDLKLALNVSRAGDRNPVLRLRQGYGACTLLAAAVLIAISQVFFSFYALPKSQ